MLELTVAAGLLGTVFLITIPLLAQVRDTREESHRRFVAQEEAANVMERLALAAANGSLADALTQEFSVSTEARDVLREPEVTVTGNDDVDDAGQRKVTARVSWLNGAGERTAPVSLDAWFAAREEQP